MNTRTGRRRTLVVGLMVVGLVGAFVGGAYGSHVFDDVPTNSYYHNDVSWLVARGITAGCGGNNYCPNDPVTRGQMAVFLHKLAARTRTANFSCDEYGFTAVSSGTTFSHGTSALVSNGPMSCPVVIPDGATVTKFTAAFIDVDTTYAEECELQRQSQASLGTFTSMASTASTGNPGNQVVYDTTIGVPLINNALNSYFVICGPTNPSASVGVWATYIEYTYQGIAAP